MGRQSVVIDRRSIAYASAMDDGRSSGSSVFFRCSTGVPPVCFLGWAGARCPCYKCDMNSEITGSHLINGQWTRSGGATFHGENPATGEQLSPPINEAGDAEVDAALAAASEAFAQSRDLPHGWQANLLETIAAK